MESAPVITMNALLTSPTCTVSAPNEVARSGTMGILMKEPKKQPKLITQTVTSRRAEENWDACMGRAKTIIRKIPCRTSNLACGPGGDRGKEKRV